MGWILGFILNSSCIFKEPWVGEICQAHSPVTKRCNYNGWSSQIYSTWVSRRVEVLEGWQQCQVTSIVKLSCFFILSVDGRVCWSCFLALSVYGAYCCSLCDMANICLLIPTEYMAPTHAMEEALFEINGT